MRAVARGAVLGLLLAGPAMAADVPPPILKAPPPAASWTGFYAGVDAGVRATSAQLSLDGVSLQPLTNGVPTGPGTIFLTPFLASDAPMDGSGARLGGYFGYNWQVAPHWVLGIEGDVAWGDETTTLSGFGLMQFGPIGNIAGADLALKTTWDASLRARLGVLATPTTLIYATAGPAWMHAEGSSQCPSSVAFGFCGGLATGGVNPYAYSSAATLPGVTVGAGIEAMIGGPWLARVEYRYAAYESLALTGPQVLPDSPTTARLVQPAYRIALRTNTASFGLAYKFGPAGPLPDAGPFAAFASTAPVPAGAWSGVYVGAAIGFRASRADLTTTSVSISGVPIDLTGTPSDPVDGIALRGGPVIGYVRQVAPRWVVGAEADVGFASQTTNLSGVALTPGPQPLSFALTGDNFALKTDWDASIRARGGFLVTPNLLAYATGGVAWQRYEVTSTCGELLFGGACILGSPQVLTSDVVKTGWTVGGGLEARLMRAWFVRGEYRYADFGTGSFQFVRSIPFPASIVDNFDIRLRTHTALFGLAYKFGDPIPATP